MRWRKMTRENHTHTHTQTQLPTSGGPFAGRTAHTRCSGGIAGAWGPRTSCTRSSCPVRPHTHLCRPLRPLRPYRPLRPSCPPRTGHSPILLLLCSLLLPLPRVPPPCSSGGGAFPSFACVDRKLTAHCYYPCYYPCCCCCCHCRGPCCCYCCCRCCC